MSKITPCLWFDDAAEEAVRYYTSLLPDSSIGRISRAVVDDPGGPAGRVLTVSFTLAGQEFVALNGGPMYSFTEAVSFQISTEDQEETDRLWDALTRDGGAPSRCGWLEDRWGLSWQILPRRLHELLSDPDPGRARRAVEAMLQMSKIDIATLERAAAG